MRPASAFNPSPAALPVFSNVCAICALLVQPWRRPAASGAADNLPVIPQPLFICIAQGDFELYTVHLQITSMQKHVGVGEYVGTGSICIAVQERGEGLCQVEGETIAYLSGRPILQCYRESRSHW